MTRYAPEIHGHHDSHAKHEEHHDEPEPEEEEASKEGADGDDVPSKEDVKDSLKQAEVGGPSSNHFALILSFSKAMSRKQL